jgi:hypothetical protein
MNEKNEEVDGVGTGDQLDGGGWKRQRPNGWRIFWMDETKNVNEEE